MHCKVWFMIIYLSNVTIVTEIIGRREIRLDYMRLMTILSLVFYFLVRYCPHQLSLFRSIYTQSRLPLLFKELAMKAAELFFFILHGFFFKTSGSSRAVVLPQTAEGQMDG